jgi:sulfonate transport system substrate-binding protein
VDFGHTGDAPPILAQAAGVPFFYIAHEPARPHAEAILVPSASPLRTLAGLEGKRVALNKGSNVQYLLVRAMESAKVAYDRVQTVFLPPSDARAAFEGGSVDAWAVWDPYFAEAELHAGARVLADGEGLVANLEFHLASRRLVRENPGVIRAIVSALDVEGRWAQAHPEEVVAMMSSELGLETEVLRRMIARKSYGIAPMEESVIEQQQRVADVFRTLGIIPGPIDVREAVVPSLLATTTGPSADGTASQGTGR